MNSSIRTILALCARDHGHATMYSRLQQALDASQIQGIPWETMIHEAEQQGVAPLFYKHLRTLGYAIPIPARRLLHGLVLRHRRANATRIQAVREILNLYARENIDVLLVKGIALCCCAYSEAGLRPMRDIDLLLRTGDLKKGWQILSDLGYIPDATHDIPDDYYHLMPMRKNIAGMPVTIELHRNLLPLHPKYPRWPLEKSYSNAWEIQLDCCRARTLCIEETIRYVCLHGFQPPLTYEPYRLIHVADIVTLVEKFHDIISWSQIQSDEPSLLNILSRFHFLTPWQEETRTHLQLDVRNIPAGCGLPYNGWPLRKIKKVQKRHWLSLGKETLWPSQWWLQIYYGHLHGRYYLQARYFDHPREIWRWAKAYWSQSVAHNGQE